MNTVFFGRATLDLAYVVKAIPAENEKIFAERLIIQPGGPALNAAITFSLLGGKGVIISCFGTREAGALVKTQAEQTYGLSVVDLAGDSSYDFPISSIIINRVAGTRTILNGPRPEGATIARSALSGMDEAVATLLLDGFNLERNLPFVADWKQKGAIIVLDGGSWKDDLREVLPLVDIAICSERFAIPGICGEGTIDRLHGFGVRMVAITHQSNAIEMSMDGQRASVPVPSVNAVDTLGAGDLLHGAFCYYYRINRDFGESLKLAAGVASNSCRYYGTHTWANR